MDALRSDMGASLLVGTTPNDCVVGAMGHRPALGKIEVRRARRGVCSGARPRLECLEGCCTAHSTPAYCEEFPLLEGGDEELQHAHTTSVTREVGRPARACVRLPGFLSQHIELERRSSARGTDKRSRQSGMPGEGTGVRIHSNRHPDELCAVGEMVLELDGTCARWDARTHLVTRSTCDGWAAYIARLWACAPLPRWPSQSKGLTLADMVPCDSQGFDGH